MRLRFLSGLLLVTGLLGCAAPEPPSPPSPTSAVHLPLPRYVIHVARPALGGAAWRGGAREHALALDGQGCGLTVRGALRCRYPPPETRPPSPAD